jgi:hypothetical protein
MTASAEAARARAAQVMRPAMERFAPLAAAGADEGAEEEPPEGAGVGAGVGEVPCNRLSSVDLSAGVGADVTIGVGEAAGDDV